ncbi:MAG: hypothetical protein WBW75_00770 [Mycobacterium sp.]|uniref:hypothetical protein n=1 Tax=Mycobacterium sp. TaxID=1785 RepID=UPI003C3AA844
MQVLAYIAAALIAVWGIAHAVPTKRVVAGFAPITADNRRVLTQEWLAESLTMWGMAALVVAVTATAPDIQVTAIVYRVVAGLLVALAVLTALTGARTPVVWFKVCPALLATSAALLLVASILVT